MHKKVTVVESPGSSVAIVETPPREPEIITKTERELDCILGPEDLARYGRELVNLIGEIGEEEDDQQAQKAAMKERLSSMQARLSKLAGTIRRGIERRTVDVEVLADWTTQTAIVRRTDTGEELDRRPLTESERQMPLSAEVAAKAAEAMASGGEA